MLWVNPFILIGNLISSFCVLIFKYMYIHAHRKYIFLCAIEKANVGHCADFLQTESRPNNEREYATTGKPPSYL